MSVASRPGARVLIGGAALAAGMVMYARSRRAESIRRDRLLQGELRELDESWNRAEGLRAYARVSALPRGRSSAIVLVHGFGVSSAYFVPAGERLAPAFNVYAPDLPGHGRTQAPIEAFTVEQHADWLARWMAAMQLPPAGIVANSMGCQIAVELAIRHPELVERMVLIGPTLDREVRPMRALLPRLMLDVAFERCSLVGILMRDYSSMGTRLRGELTSMMEHRIEERLPLVSRPVMFVRGGRDPIVSQRWVDELAALTPNSTAAIIPRWGHAVHYSSVDELVPIIAPFLSRADAHRQLCDSDSSVAVVCG